MEIRDVQPADSGHFICHASNPYGQQTARVRLLVQGVYPYGYLYLFLLCNYFVNNLLDFRIVSGIARDPCCNPQECWIRTDWEQCNNNNRYGQDNTVPVIILTQYYAPISIIISCCCWVAPCQLWSSRPALLRKATEGPGQPQRSSVQSGCVCGCLMSLVTGTLPLCGV